MDKNDKKIIELLKKDSRMTIRDIAKKTRLRPSTVHNRIQKMRKSGLVERFTVKLDNKMAGENLVAFMLIASEGKIPNTAFRNDHIKDVFGITGEYDLMIKMKFEDIEEFNKFIIEFRNKYHIKKTHTMIGTIMLKES